MSTDVRARAVSLRPRPPGVCATLARFAGVPQISAGQQPPAHVHGRRELLAGKCFFFYLSVCLSIIYLSVSFFLSVRLFV